MSLPGGGGEASGPADLSREFQLRHRLPRPISRSYEAACFAPPEEAHRARWCARVALRLLAALEGDHGARAAG